MLIVQNQKSKKKGLRALHRGDSIKVKRTIMLTFLNSKIYYPPKNKQINHIKTTYKDTNIYDKIMYKN